MVECCIKLAEDRPGANDGLYDRKQAEGRTRLPDIPRIGRHEESRDKDGYNLPLAAVSVGPLGEAGLLILRLGEPEIGEGDGDLR